jgi:hypothetical protein
MPATLSGTLSPPILPAAQCHEAEADGARVTGSRYIEPAHVIRRWKRGEERCTSPVMAVAPLDSYCAFTIG